MECDFTGKEAYRQYFNPKDYLNMHMQFESENIPVHEDLFSFVLENLQKAFLVDGIGGDTLIDIGSGPSIYQLLSACEAFKEIIDTDFLEQNREEMQKWLKKDPEAFDWTSMVKYACQLEGNRENWMEKEEKLRKAIKRVLKCDVTLANPLDPLVLKPADCVLSTFCLESACKDLPTYRSAMRNVGSLVKPRGHLIFAAVTQETFYMVGPHRFSSLYLTPEVVRDAVKEAGFQILWSKMSSLHWSPEITDAHDVIFMVAQKLKGA
ncbi:nicotinamide N-methyltransferase-like [Anolis sagrei]|uniref:nicotinamide N-methyltransferase-like n=1 Tax=Anolis sagrei TaxID=38937 RepID=UPI0035220AC4